jgi:pimeloyl-ACP methyl ester carboxylesterase
MPSATAIRRYDIEEIGLTAGDGRRLTLLHVRGAVAPTRGPVLLVHGAGVRADIFMAPVDTTIIDALLEAGHDVWLENWRASIDLPACEWFLDDAAVHDHPVAVKAVVDHTGVDEVQAIVHCQGSTSFVMSAAAGLLPNVTTIVSNAVSLHPIIPATAEFKLRRISPLVARIVPYFNPQWGVHADTFVERAFLRLVRMTHHECDNDVCRLVSFTYGTGFPALWSHDNLSDATHEWLKGEFADVPLTFFDQMGRSVARGHLVAHGNHPEIPLSMVAQPPKTDARFVLVAGEDNRCFLPESQRRTFEYLDGLHPSTHEFHQFPKYGHLDVFMGERAAFDTFPTIVGALQ